MKQMSQFKKTKMSMKAWLFDLNGRKKLVVVPLYFDTVEPIVPTVVKYKSGHYILGNCDPLSYTFAPVVGVAKDIV